jgi:hypothetical protein
MSIEPIKNEIERLLSSPEPEVICISGKWGVGKTYAWKKYLKEAQANDLINDRYKAYAYVTLFGQNSLQEVKNSIFPSTAQISTLNIENSIDNNLFYQSIKKLKKDGRSLLSKALNLGQNALSQYVPISGIDQIFLYFVKNQIICIDDIERHGQDMQVKEILGLASFLKEEKKCKVVIILNDEMLEEGDSKVFKEQLEKVVDVFLKFEPSAEEAADIAIDSNSNFHEALKNDCIKLGIVNIRVIRKIQRLAYLLEQKLKSFDDKIFSSFLHSLALLGWAVYEPSQAPSIDFIKENSRYFSTLIKKENGKISEQELAWGELLNSFGWTHFDESDLMLLESIRSGYFDEIKLQSAAIIIADNLVIEGGEKSFRQAWEKYHDSFDMDQEEVLISIKSAFMENAKHISKVDLDSTIRFFKEFGKTSEATEMIKHYMLVHPGDKDFYNLKRYSFQNEVSDPEVIAAFDNKLSEFSDDRDPLEVLKKIAKDNGWNPEDIELLSKLTTDNFYHLFKNAHGKEKHAIIRGVLIFKTIANIGQKELDICNNAIQALKKISDESLMNKKRVASYGNID